MDHSCSEVVHLVRSEKRTLFNGNVNDEPLTDFFAKTRGPYPVKPDLNPGGGLACVGDDEFELIFRDGDGWARFRQEFQASSLRPEPGNGGTAYATC